MYESCLMLYRPFRSARSLLTALCVQCIWTDEQTIDQREREREDYPKFGSRSKVIYSCTKFDIVYSKWDRIKCSPCRVRSPEFPSTDTDMDTRVLVRSPDPEFESGWVPKCNGDWWLCKFPLKITFRQSARVCIYKRVFGQICILEVYYTRAETVWPFYEVPRKLRTPPY